MIMIINITQMSWRASTHLRQFNVAYYSFVGQVKGLKSNLRKTLAGVFLEIFSSTIHTTEIILSRKLNLECSKSVKYERMYVRGGLETTPFRVVWLQI